MKTILIPTDFSVAAEPAIRMAVFLAKRSGAKLLFYHLSYFSETQVKFGSTYDQAYREVMDAARGKLKSLITTTLAREPEIKWESLVSFGPSASDAILETAVKKKVSLIVMGTHGATGLKKVFFGSNTAHVISSGKVPVMAVPQTTKFTGPAKVIYSTDLVNASEETDTVKKILAGK